MSIRRRGRPELRIDLDSCDPTSTEADTGTAVSEFSTPTRRSVTASVARAKALSLHASRVAAELESQIAAVGRSAAPVETTPAPAVVVSKEEEDLVARARALLSDAEPAPAPTRVEPVEDDDLDIDMDLIRRARALRGASQLARTESK